MALLLVTVIKPEDIGGAFFPAGHLLAVFDAVWQ